jgi:hypothetical protein
MELSYPDSLALTLNTTKGILNVAWAITKLINPLGMLALAKKDNSAIPSTISGITTGIYSRPSITDFPLNLYLYIPTAANVPIITATVVLTTATNIVFPKEVRSAEFWNNFSYQTKEKPFHVIYGFVVLLLNEFTTTTKIGKNKKR